MLSISTVFNFSGAKLGALFTGLSVVYVAAGFAVEQVALVGLLVLAYRRLGHRVADWSSSHETVHLLFRQSVPAMISAVVVQLFFRINQLLLGAIYKDPSGSLAEVGQYGMAFQIVQLTNMLPSVIFAAIYPRLVVLHADQPQRYWASLRWLLIGSSVMGYVLVLGAYLLGQPVLHLVFGSKFDLGTKIMVDY